VEFTQTMNDVRSTGVPADGDRAGIDRKALWVVRELGLPTIVKACVSCRTSRHRPTGKFRVNASGKLLDVWLLICCESCGRTSKIPVHERVHVRALDHERLVEFQDNDAAAVRRLAVDPALAGRAGYRLDWNGTWDLDTDLPFAALDDEDPPALEVVVRFELPVPVRVEQLLRAGFGLSRSTLKGVVDSGRLRLPVAVDAKVREDFTFLVLPVAPRG
jgi:hypothetical protein